MADSATGVTLVVVVGAMVVEGAVVTADSVDVEGDVIVVVSSGTTSD
jgi:hypothetical protein